MRQFTMRKVLRHVPTAIQDFVSIVVLIACSIVAAFGLLAFGIVIAVGAKMISDSILQKLGALL